MVFVGCDIAKVDDISSTEKGDDSVVCAIRVFCRCHVAGVNAVVSCQRTTTLDDLPLETAGVAVDYVEVRAIESDNLVRLGGVAGRVDPDISDLVLIVLTTVNALVDFFFWQLTGLPQSLFDPTYITGDLGKSTFNCDDVGDEGEKERGQCNAKLNPG